MNKQNTFILIFIVIASSYSSVYAQNALRGTLDANAECSDCYNYYIKNGCFECYDSLLLNNHPYYMDYGHSAQNIQFQKALDVVEPVVNLSGNRHENCKGWYSPTGGTPNYFHTNFINDQSKEPKFWFNVPINRMNKGQPPQIGSSWESNNNLVNGYTGIYVSPHPNDAIRSEREFIQQKLNNPLSPDSCYFVSFDVSLANSNMSGLDKIGAYLSNQAPYNENYRPANEDEMLYTAGSNNELIKPQIISMSAIGSPGWTNVSGYITPNETINYITIGYFEDSFRAGIQFGDTIAYFIDNVFIVLSLKCKQTI